MIYDNQYGDDGSYLPVTDYLSTLAGAEPHPHSVMAQALRMAADVAQIANEYNVRVMTPEQMTEMCRHLYLIGAISLPEYAVMSFQPHLHQDFNAEIPTYRAMQEEFSRPRDFIAAWEEHLHFIRQHHPNPESVFLSTEILDLLQSFEPIEEPLE